MIDTYLRVPYQQTLVSPLLHLAVRKNIPPNAITAMGLLCGVCIVPCLAFGLTYAGFILLLLSGYFDTLDGTLARIENKTTPLGAAFDIVADRLVEFSVVLALFLVEPESRGLLALLMLGSILICITTFLVVGIFVKNSGDKGFHYSPGLMERTEAFAFFAIMILFPSMFPVLAALFAVLVFLTACIRVYEFAAHGADL